MSRSSGKMNRKAYSLIEVLVSQAILGVCLLGIAALAKAGTRYLLVTNAKTDLQRDAILTLRGISQQFQETNDGSFTVGNSLADPNGSVNYGVVFGSPRDPKTGHVDYDSVGRLLWCKYVCYYKRDINGPCIVRAVAKLDPKLPYPPPVNALDDFLRVDYGFTLVARNVTQFECSKDSANLSVLLRVELPSNYGKNYGFLVQTQVFARN